MQYQDFLQLAGITANSLSESDYSQLIEPVFQDRRDLFPTQESVALHYFKFGLHGFSDDFISAIDRLVDCLEEAQFATGVMGDAFDRIVEMAMVNYRGY